MIKVPTGTSTVDYDAETGPWRKVGASESLFLHPMSDEYEMEGLCYRRSLCLNEIKSDRFFTSTCTVLVQTEK